MLYRMPQVAGREACLLPTPALKLIYDGATTLPSVKGDSLSNHSVAEELEQLLKRVLAKSLHCFSFYIRAECYKHRYNIINRTHIQHIQILDMSMTILS
jgi:hypothetical protein